MFCSPCAGLEFVVPRGDLKLAVAERQRNLHQQDGVNQCYALPVQRNVLQRERKQIGHIFLLYLHRSRYCSPVSTLSSWLSLSASSCSSKRHQLTSLSFALFAQVSNLLSRVETLKLALAERQRNPATARCQSMFCSLCTGLEFAVPCGDPQTCCGRAPAPAPGNT